MVQLLGKGIVGDQPIPYKDSLAMGVSSTTPKGSLSQKATPTFTYSYICVEYRQCSILAYTVCQQNDKACVLSNEAFMH